MLWYILFPLILNLNTFCKINNLDCYLPLLTLKNTESSLNIYFVCPCLAKLPYYYETIQDIYIELCRNVYLKIEFDRLDYILNVIFKCLLTHLLIFCKYFNFMLWYAIKTLKILLVSTFCLFEFV